MPFALIALAGLVAQADAPQADAEARPGPASSAPGYSVVGGRQVYEPAYFADITPRTASDMLFEVPGFVVTETGEGRGLGQGGTNVLINGARITGKGTGPVELLRRTPAASVLRIEVVDAASLGIPGLTGQVADVYLAAQGLTGNWAWRPTFREALEPDLANAAVSVSGQAGPVTYTLGVENDGFRRGNRGPERLLGPTGLVLEERLEDAQFTGERPAVTGAIVWNRENGDLANFAASYEWFVLSIDERRESRLPDGARAFLESGTKEDERNGELSGDYATDALGGRLKLIGLVSFEHSPRTNAFTVQGTVQGPDGFEGGYFDQTVDEGERIGRAEMVWGTLGGTLELAAEGAFNFLEAEDEGGTLLADGTRVPASASAVRVEELRGQSSLALSRPLGPLDTQASLGVEVSEISQPGSDNPPRSFVRPKGFLSAAYEANEDTDLRLRLERRVGQLDFFDFVSSVDLVNDQASCGNPDIVPQQSWYLEGQVVRRFGAETQVTLTAYGEAITDRVDRVPLPCGADGPGNIDSASAYGASAQGSVGLDRVWSGVEVDFTLRAQESRLDDPFDGRPRAFGRDEEWSWRVDARRDVPNSPWAYGLGGRQERLAAQPRRQDRTRDRDDPFVYVFAEHRDVLGAELNVTVGNVFGQRERRRREVFGDADAGRGPLSAIEDRTRTFGPTLQVTLSDTF